MKSHQIHIERPNVAKTLVRIAVKLFGVYYVPYFRSLYWRISCRPPRCCHRFLFEHQGKLFIILKSFSLLFIWKLITSCKLYLLISQFYRLLATTTTKREGSPKQTAHFRDS